MKFPPTHLLVYQFYVASQYLVCNISWSWKQAAGDAGQSAVEYLATVVEFDAWDKLDKDWTSNVALRNMTPENVRKVYCV